MTELKHLAAAVILLLLQAGYAMAEITAENAYIPRLPAGASVFAAYATISNSGAESVRISEVSAQGFMMAHVHESRMIDGVATMESIKELEIRSGETLVMQPGGLHLMLMQPTASALSTGQVALTIRFTDGQSIQVMATVKSNN